LSPLNTLLLARLDSTPSPVVGLRELPPHTEAELRELKQSGVLVDAGIPEEIVVEPGRSLRIKKIGASFFGFDDEEECPRPQKLTPEDATQYRIAVPAFIARLVSLNQIEGTATVSPALASGLYPIGRKSISGEVVSVWLAVAFGAEPSAIAGRLAQLAMDDAHARHVVIFPRWPDVSPADSSALSARGVHLADLDSASLVIRWPDALRRDAAPTVPEYGLIHEGATWRIHFLGTACTIPDKTGSLYLARILSDHRYQWTPTEVYTGNKNAVAKSSNSRTARMGDQEDGTRISQTMSAGAGRVSDHEAENLRTQREELMADIRAAQRNEDESEEARLTEDLAQFDETYASTLGLGNRSRSDGPEESTRKNVSLQISNILNALAKTQPAVAKHIRDHLSLGSAMTYTPDRGEAWTVVFPKK
jgi:hypothetical protein